LFPLLIALSTLIGFILSSETSTYFSLLNYLDRMMPRSAFAILGELLGQLATGASGGKLSFGAIAPLWTASSGITALIEALNVAFEVSNMRSWWHRRTVALGLIFGIGLLCASALALLFAGVIALFLALRDRRIDYPRRRTKCDYLERLPAALLALLRSRGEMSPGRGHF